MDSQFNNLRQSYSDNYIQYKVTGNPSYQNAYTSAQQGLESIIDQLTNTVNTEKKGLSDFYKSGIEQKLQKLDSNNKLLQRGIISEKDEVIAAQIRQSAPPPPSPSISTTQYVLLGGLTTAVIVMSFL
jgi:hypothetical protein